MKFPEKNSYISKFVAWDYPRDWSAMMISKSSSPGPNLVQIIRVGEYSYNEFISTHYS